MKIVDDHDPNEQARQRKLQAWRHAIQHLTERGLPPLGVPLDVLVDLYPNSDDTMLHALDRMWDAA